MADYKIELGIGLNSGDFADIKKKIESLESDPIKLEVDAETKELTNTIKEALNSLSKGTKNALTLNTSKLEASLNDVTSTIREIKTAMGTLDSGSGMKSLVSSINSISTALDKASAKFDELVGNLKSLSGKDFNLNFGINLGGSNPIGRNAAYGNKVRTDTLPQLKQQTEALNNYLKEYYKVADGFIAVQKLGQGTSAMRAGRTPFELLPQMLDESGSLSSRMAAYKEYISFIKEAASLRGIDLSHITSGFSKSADELVKDAQDIQTGAKEMDESFDKLRQIFGGGNNLNVEGLSKQLDSIVVDLGEIKTALQGLSSGISIDGLTQSFDRLSETIEKLVKNCTAAKQTINDSVNNVGKSVGQGSGETALKETSNELKKLKDLARQIGQLDFKILKSNYKDEVNQVREFERQLELLKTQYNETVNSLNAKDIDINSKDITKEFANARNKIAEFEAKVADTKAELAKNIKSNIGAGIAKDIDKAHTDFDKLSNKTKELQAKLNLLDNIKIDLDEAAAVNDVDRLIDVNTRYQKVLKDVQTQIDISQSVEKIAFGKDAFTLDKEKAMLRLKNLFGKNSEAAKNFASDLDRIQKELRECGSPSGLQIINKDIDVLGRKVKESGVQVQTFGQRLKKQFQQYSSYLSIASLFQYAEQGLRSMFEQVKLIDSAMTELKKVTNETDAAYNEFLTNAADRAKVIGTTIDGLVSSTADFARLGYGFEDAQGLAEVANIYAVVGDEIEGVEGATESLISTMAAFKDEMNGMSNTDFAMSIIDKFNEIGNNFAISSGGIGEALERSASSLMAANNTIDESIALITAANTVVQDPEQVGTAFKTISMRIRGAKTELEEAGLETEGMVDSTAKLRSEILALTGVDIMENANEFKSTYKIMDELAVKWKDLSDIQQATVTELIAGKRQGNIVSSLMTNFQTARDALDTSMNSAGSAMAEHEKWMLSVEASINKVKASWQSLSQAFLKSDFLKGLLNGVSGLANAFAGLIDTVGTLPTLLGTIAAGFSAFKNEGFFTFDKQTQSIQLFGAALTDLKGSYNKIQTAIHTYNSNLGKSKGLQDAYINALNKQNSGLGKYLSGLNGTKASFSGYISSLVGATIKTIALEAATIALNAAITMGVSFAISALIKLIGDAIETKAELAEKVDEVTSKFKEQHNELKKLQGNYDTSNESSMISKYEKLSKGVDGLGRNVSLTADEYSEYQSIVNQIAEQIPSLVSGYDSQGNAILSCKGNVEELTNAYQKLIHAQNTAVLGENARDIEDNFKNTVSQASGYDFWEFIGNSYDVLSVLFGGKWNHFDMKVGTADLISNLVNAKSQKERDDALTAIESTRDHQRAEILQALQNANIDAGVRSDLSEVLGEVLEKEPEKIKNILDTYYAGFDDAIATYKTKATALLSEAFDVGSTVSGLDYGNISEELQNIAYQTVNSLDYDFLSNLTENGKTIDQWTKEMLDQLNALSEADNKKIETGFELQTKFNGGDISYGQYISQLQETVDFIDKDLKVPDEVKNQIKLSLNSEDILSDYNALVYDLKNIGFDDTSINKFLNSLSAEEFSAAMKIIPDLDAGTTINEIQALIDERLATEFKFDIAIQAEGIEVFNNALTESRSAAGLTSESITALKARYEDLEGFNATALFEKTANGIHLNSEELSRLEEQYINTNKLEIDKNLSKLVSKYNDLTEEIKSCTDAQEKEKLQLQADAYKDKIDELSTLASQYDGLTSAFAKWQTALEGAEEGDNYDSLYENLEGIKELYDKGLVGTDKFKTATQLMTNKDLANADIDEIVSAYKKGYPKMQRYFTEGQKGCKRFLNDVRNLNSEWAHMNKDGSWEINFNAEEVAKELDVSVDFVLQIAKKLKDYGFEVNLEDSSIDNLKTKIEQTEAKLKELGQAPVDINVDIEANSKNLGTIESEIEKAKSKISEINNSSVEPKVKTAQLEDAKAKLEALIDKKIEASQPAFMNLNTSQVNASLVDALEKVKSYQNAINEVNKLSELKEAGIAIDDSQLQKAKEKVDECAKAIQGLDGEVKMAIGLEEDGSIDSIKKAFENGKVKIDANTDPALTKIEQLAENVERIEDKDVTINVTVNGLDKVKELNKQIDLATDIDGDINKLSKYVESAKALNDIGDNITSKVTADVQGNVIKTPEYEINNLKVFSDSAKDVHSIGHVSSKVTADIEGNVFDNSERTIDNLKVYTDSAKDIKEFKGDISSKITADIEGDVFDKNESTINNLEVFIDSAKGIKEIEGNITSNITANTLGSVFTDKERSIDNLDVYIESAKGIRDIEGNIISNITADVDGSVFTDSERTIDNLKVFIESAKGVKDFEGDIVSNITANTLGSVFTDSERITDNLKTFIDSANGIKDIEGDIVSNITANTLGSVFTDKEKSIDNLDVFIESAEGIKDIEGDIVSNITANTLGSVFTDSERSIDNLKVFVESAKGVKDIEGDIVSNITANTLGSVFTDPERETDNLNVFVDSAKGIKDIEGDIVSNITANTLGSVFTDKEKSIDNLKVFIDSAKGIKEIEGNISSSITADVNGNVFDKYETTIDNLGVFVKSAKGIKNIEGDISSKVTANVYGNVLNTKDNKLSNLGVFADNAKKLKGIGNFSSSVSANATGNAVEGEGVSSRLSSLTEFKSIVSGMTNQTVAVNVTAKVDSENVNAAIDLLKKVSNSGVFKDYKATVQVGAKIATIDDTTVKNYKAPPKEGKVSYSVNPDSSVYTWTAPSKDGVVNYSAEVEALTNGQKHKTGTITYTPKIKGFPVVNGTANANGSAFVNSTSGKAFKQGDWGVKKTTTALTGELGQELVVYGNRFWTVGDHGAEFATIPKGAIVFNHKQTKELFANGKVVSDGGRGRIFANGTAYAEGTAFAYGRNQTKREMLVDGSSQMGSSTGNTSGSGSFYGNDDDDNKTENKFEDTIDWIETILDRAERAIDKYEKQADNIYKTWAKRNKALENEIAEVDKTIGLYEQAKNKYLSEANAVGLEQKYVDRIKYGLITGNDAIQDFEGESDEKLVEKIKNYQDLYEKYLDCVDKIDELKEKEASLYAQRFENVQSEYENLLQGFDHTQSMLDEYISQAEEKGYIVSKNYYAALIDNEEDRINTLKQEQAALIKARDEAVANDEFDKYSEEWYSMCEAIDSVTQAIEEGNTALIEYSNSIRDIEWEVFDLIQERISDITSEADFLIELMSNKDLFDDNGKFTSQGVATAGLHAQNYNTYMYQADEYGKEAAEIDKQLAKDPYDQELINRRRELIELQREMILNAEGEKNAVRDLVEEGINLELEALDERIQKYEEALDSQKD